MSLHSAVQNFQTPHSDNAGMRSSWTSHSQAEHHQADATREKQQEKQHQLQLQSQSQQQQQQQQQSQQQQPQQQSKMQPQVQQPPRIESPSNGIHSSTEHHRSSSRKASHSAPVRRRISRACDQCNQLRTKCDGQTPCAHCLEFGLNCEYARERKKRGKVSKRHLAQQAANSAAAAAAVGDTPSAPSNPSSNGAIAVSQAPNPSKPAETNQQDGAFARNFSGQMQNYAEPPNQSLRNTASVKPLSATVTHQNGVPVASSMDAVVPTTGFTQLSDVHCSSVSVSDIQALQPATTSQPFSDYQHTSYSAMAQPQALGTLRFPSTADSGSLPYLGFSPPSQPTAPWINLPSPPVLTPYVIPGVTNTLKYPVLQPVLPHIVSIIPQSLACDLLDHYYSTSPSNFMCPQSPYVVGFFFRKQSFFHPTNPRRCTPALLASMLWIASQSSEAAFLTSPPSARGRVCQKLLELTISLLKPLIHNSDQGDSSLHYPSNVVMNGVALGGLNIPVDHVGVEHNTTGALDDVITYMHIATVVSASEYKSASMRWWSAAYSLARELKLGRELPPNPPQRAAGELAPEDMEPEYHHRNMPRFVSEEEREERRKVWWMLYTMDRHLALCYNRPLSLLDRECETLLQPMSEAQFQAGDFSNPNLIKVPGSNTPRYRHVGPSYEVTDYSMFGYFLPLMTILGEIIDLYHLRNHPRFGSTFRNGNEWDPMVAEITRQLEIYGQSLREFDARYSNVPLRDPSVDGNAADVLPDLTPPAGPVMSGTASDTNKSGKSTAASMHESYVQTKIVVAYGTHIMHVLHILLAGKWDPISLLDDNDLWISSESFIRAMGHAVSAAEAAADILDLDPDLSFMPYFFGVYLLQGSFLLLLTADKLQGDASPSVVRACETIVRAHEACVVTLNNEYQVSLKTLLDTCHRLGESNVPRNDYLYGVLVAFGTKKRGLVVKMPMANANSLKMSKELTY
ncbi:hypothetical protein KEM54_005485 [Ascosphaera aggregata]|nr:hypothetical protein KEM54_005485 [Ascosphaera aggregata]